MITQQLTGRLGTVSAEGHWYSWDTDTAKKKGGDGQLYQANTPQALPCDHMRMEDTALKHPDYGSPLFLPSAWMIEMTQTPTSKLLLDSSRRIQMDPRKRRQLRFVHSQHLTMTDPGRNNDTWKWVKEN